MKQLKSIDGLYIFDYAFRDQYKLRKIASLFSPEAMRPITFVERDSIGTYVGTVQCVLVRASVYHIAKALNLVHSPLVIELNGDEGLAHIHTEHVPSPIRVQMRMDRPAVNSYYVLSKTSFLEITPL